MVTQEHSINTVLDSRPHIIRRLHPLQHNRHTTASLSDPRQILPRQGLVNILRHQTTESAALLILAALPAADSRADGTGLRSLLVGLSLTGDGCVDGDEDGLDAEILGAVEDVFGLLALRVDVELEEERLVGRGGVDDGL